MHTYQFFTAIHRQTNAVVVGSYNVDLELRSIRRRVSKKVNDIICAALDANGMPCPSCVKAFVEKHSITHHMEDWEVKYSTEREMCGDAAQKYVRSLMELYQDIGFVLNPSFYGVK